MDKLFTPQAFEVGGGPLYLRLHRLIVKAIASGRLKPGDCLPSERDLATMIGLSRVTVRKGMAKLIASGQLVQRRGSGTFVTPQVERLERALSVLTSFTEEMVRRNRGIESRWIWRGLHIPALEEVMALGLRTDERVVRLERTHNPEGLLLAIERASLPQEVLPSADYVAGSLYTALAARGLRPARAELRITAENLDPVDAGLLGIETGAAGLRIERISYLPSGRAVEFTRLLYRGDACDFAVELKLVPGSRRNR